MKKKKGTVKYKAAGPTPYLAAVQLVKVDELMNKRRWVEAHEILVPLNRRFPNRPEILSPLANVSIELSDMETYQYCCERILKVIPDDPDAMMGLGGAYLSNARPALALKAFRRFIARWPEHPRADDARRTLTGLEANMKNLLDEIEVEGEQGFQIAEMHEEVQSLMGQQKFTQARRAAEELLRIKPDFVPGLNNISLTYFIEGRIDRAMESARRVLASKPDNYHALSNLTRFLMLSGHAEEAKGTAERLKAIENFQDDDVWVKKIEALSFLGDDQGALEAFEGAQKANALEDSPKAPFIYHLAAVASFRMGREEEARRYWKQSLRLDPTFSLAKENLEDLKNPVGERNGAWPFDLTSWIPRRTIEDIASTMRAGGKDEKSAARRIMRNHPEIDQIIPALLDRGDPHGREFALRLARMLETPAMLTALRDFALGQRGSDQQRHLAAQTASQAGLLPTGQARMWLNGEWQEIFLIGIQIHGEAQDRFKPQTERLLIEAGMAYREFDGKRAEQLYKQALELEPDSIRIMNNVAGAYSMQGRTEEAKALIWKIHERDPDYLFARTSLSKFLVEEGKLDQAEEMLRPLLERRRMHHSEFGSFCDAWINLNVARGKDKEAVAWLQIWEGMGEEHPILEVWQRKLKKKRSRFR